MNRKKITLFSGNCLIMLLLSLAACSNGAGNQYTSSSHTPATLTPKATASSQQTSSQSITIAQRPYTPTATAAPSPTPSPQKTATPSKGGTSGGSTGSNPPTNMGGSNSNESQIAQAVFQAVNQARANAGLPPLQWNNGLVASAHQHNLTMKAANTLSHQLPGEAAFGDRERQQGVQWSSAAENIGYNSDKSVNGARGLFNSMMAEVPPNDGHRQNILSAQSNSIGIDILIDTQNNKLWLTQDFAKV